MPRPDATEERTQQIIEAAFITFARLGIGKTRMEDIAKAAGLSKGTLYLYFKSKDALISSMLELTVSRELAYAQELSILEIPVHQKLDQLTQIVVDDLEQMQPLMSVYFEFLAVALRNEMIKTTMQEQFQRFLDLLIALIEQGVEAGEFRAVDAREAALTMGTIFEGTILVWAYGPEMVDLGQQIKAGMDLLLTGLRSG